MFKKGQLVRNDRSGKLYMFKENQGDDLLLSWVPLCGWETSTSASQLELIGNNYKEKPRDAIPERRDSYK